MYICIYVYVYICIYVYISNTRAWKYIKKVIRDLKVETENNIIVGDCSTSLSEVNRLSRQKVNMEIMVLNCILEQKELTDI